MFYSRARTYRQTDRQTDKQTDRQTQLISLPTAWDNDNDMSEEEKGTLGRESKLSKRLSTTVYLIED